MFSTFYTPLIIFSLTNNYGCHYKYNISNTKLKSVHKAKEIIREENLLNTNENIRATSII